MSTGTSAQNPAAPIGSRRASFCRRPAVQGLAGPDRFPPVRRVVPGPVSATRSSPGARARGNHLSRVTNT